MVEMLANVICKLTGMFFEQVSTIGDMARPARGRGRRKRGREEPRGADPGTSEPRRGIKPVERLIHEATIAYRVGTDTGIRKILEDWEEQIKEEADSEEEMEVWREVIPDPRNTRGRLTQFK